MTEETAVIDEMLNFVNEMKILIKEDMYNNDSIKDLKKSDSVEITKLEEALLKNIGENDLNILKTELPVFKWEYFTKKLACPYEYFDSLDDYQNPVDNLKKEEFFSKLKNLLNYTGRNLQTLQDKDYLKITIKEV